MMDRLVELASRRDHAPPVTDAATNQAAMTQVVRPSTFNLQPSTGPLLRVRGLRTSFFTRDGEVKAVDGIDLTLERGRTLGLVGESGCGKSVTSLSLMRLLRAPGRTVGGEILLEGTDLTRVSERQMRA